MNNKKPKQKKKYQFKTPSRKQPVWRIVKPILKLFGFRNIETINLAGEIPSKCIFVGNHNGKKGPLGYEIYLPTYTVKWGAYKMLGNYKDRYDYLRNVLYIQKCHKNKFVATVKSLFEALFSLLIYRGIKVIPSFNDARILKTFSYSLNVLDNDMAVMVYPEDSSTGYYDEPIKYLNGFVALSEFYYKRRGEDLPVYPVYMHLKKKKFIIGKPLKVNELKQEGLSREEIAEKFRVESNALYQKYVKE